MAARDERSLCRYFKIVVSNSVGSLKKDMFVSFERKF